MKKKIIISVISLFIVIGAWMGYSIFISSPYSGENAANIYIDDDDTKDSVITKMQSADVSTFGFNTLSIVRSYKPRAGRYKIEKGMNAWKLFSKLRNGAQDAVNVVVPSARTLSFDKLAGALAHNLMLDSVSVLNALNDSAFIQQYGYSKETLPALFIPNTYSVNWDITMEKLMERMQKENKRFWNDEREQKAKNLNMSHEEIATLASIVDEETANNTEKPMVAGLYLNRLKKDMLLQADPTVKVAVGDWSLRRVLNSHLKTESPYNTYINKGLPPGPIRVSSIAGIDAVLNYTHHDYIYMCAKEDFSGTHNFAETLAEHNKNAKRYTDALNKRGIKK